MTMQGAVAVYRSASSALRRSSGSSAGRGATLRTRATAAAASADDTATAALRAGAAAYIKAYALPPAHALIARHANDEARLLRLLEHPDLDAALGLAAPLEALARGGGGGALATGAAVDENARRDAGALVDAVNAAMDAAYGRDDGGHGDGGDGSAAAVSHAAFSVCDDAPPLAAAPADAANVDAAGPNIDFGDWEQEQRDGETQAARDHLFLQRLLYRVNRLQHFWFDAPGRLARVYRNERALFLAALRGAVEARWQRWELARLPAGSGIAAGGDVAAALEARCDGRRPFPLARERVGLRGEQPSSFLPMPFTPSFPPHTTPPPPPTGRSYRRDVAPSPPPPPSEAGAAAPRRAPLDYFALEAPPRAYAHLLAIGALDGLVEASRQARVRLSRGRGSAALPSFLALCLQTHRSKHARTHTSAQPNQTPLLLAYNTHKTCTPHNTKHAPKTKRSAPAPPTACRAPSSAFSATSTAAGARSSATPRSTARRSWSSASTRARRRTSTSCPGRCGVGAP